MTAKHSKYRSRDALRALAALAILSVGSWVTARAQTAPLRTAVAATLPNADARSARWRESFEAFDAADKAQAPQLGGVLFVGSSSIRLWDGLAQDFASLPVVIQRGFGGSRLSDCAEHLSRLVLPYKPRIVIVYAGDNDLAEGATPEQVLATYQRFVAGVHAELPHTQIAYLSIKPSPLRAALMPQAMAANELIRAYSATRRDTHYIDIFSKMLGDDGQPRREFFGPDMLHLNRSGYALWTQEVSRRLAQIETAPSVTAGAAPPEAPRAAP